MAVSDWTDLFQSAGQQYGVDPLLLQAVATTESGGNPKAVSSAGAIGPMQLMPETAQALGVSDPTDPRQAIPAAARLLVQNGKQFGSPEGAVLAYHGGTDQKNWGPKTKAYLAKVSQTYQQLKAGSPMAQPQAQDAFSQAFGQDAAPAAQTAPAAPAAPAQAQADPFTMAFGDTSQPKGATPKVQSAAQPSILESAARGVVRGYKDAVGSVVPVDAWIADKLGFHQTANNLRNNLATFQSEAPAFKQQYGAAGQVGEALGQVATTLPAFAAGGEAIAPLAAGARAAAPAAAPMVDFLEGTYKGNKLMQLASRGTAGAAQGATAAALTSGSSAAPLGQQVQQGAELGGALGVAAPVLVGAGKSVTNKLTGGGVAPAKAALANAAVNTYGIPLRGSQISNSPFAKYLDSAIGKVPFSGMEAQNEAQRTAFSRAVAGTFGETADNLTPQVMSRARARIGGVFNRVANNTTIDQQATSDMANKFAQIETEAQQVMPANEYIPIKKQMDGILSKVSPSGEIDGATYQALTRKGAPLDAALNSKDPNIRHYAGQIRSALDDALQASANPQDLADLKTARLQWKNMRTVQDLAAKAGIEGEISPALLLGAVKKSYKDMPYSGAGAIGDLAHIGQQFLKEPPSSGTGERLALYSMLGAGSEGVGTLLHDPDALLHTGAVLGGVSGMSRLIGYGLKSRLYRDALLRSAAKGQGALHAAFGGSHTLNSVLQNASPYALPAGVMAGNQLVLNHSPVSGAP